MKKKFIYALLLICMLVGTSFDQSKKEVKKNKIKSITEFITVKESGKDVTYKSYYIAFNKNGEIVEETEYNSNGSLKKKETTKYDANNNKIETTYYCQKKTNQKAPNPEPTEIVNSKTVYKYNVHNDKIEESDIDPNNGKLIKMHSFIYNSKGEKEAEETYDTEKKLLKKVTFVYDSKGLKTEKKFFGGNNALEMVKKYVYEF
jgi:hypothetical protein